MIDEARTGGGISREHRREKDRTIAHAFLPQRKGGIEGRQGIMEGSPALTHERNTALCSREIPPPVRAWEGSSSAS